MTQDATRLVDTPQRAPTPGPPELHRSRAARPMTAR